MKLYATMFNAFSGKTEGIGGKDGETIVVRLSNGNKPEYEILYDGLGITINRKMTTIFNHEIRGIKQKGEKCEVCGEPLLDNHSISGNRHSACI
jgi:hypothetical protein